MQKLTLDSTLRARLNGLNAEVEVCDEAGHTVGYFLPADYHRQLLYAWAKAQVSPAELEEARKQSGGRSLKEIVGSMNKVPC